ncbi:MAG TPA: hypothetical protein VFK35_11075 [Candidatus Limnocylindrales bacterium]|nr:hypothetical protein [Candidatus Limnocylindrales bacterium]
MTFLAGIFGVLGRFAGKLLTTTLGWASTLLFGRVPQSRQIVLALVTFGSVIWAALVIGVILPDLGAFLVAAVPAPEAIDRGWLRLAMLVGALIVPAIVGIATIFVVDPASRPRGAAIVGQVVRGYPLSAALAATLVILAGVAIVRFVHHLAIRWVDAHVPIVVHPGGYDQVVADLERALDDAGLAVDRKPAPLPLALPGRMLARVAGPGIGSLVPNRPVELVGPDLEVGIYLSDIAIAGRTAVVARARSAIATRLTATAASMTTSAEAQAVEARIEALSRPSVAGGTPGGAQGAGGEAELAPLGERLAAIDRDLATLEVSHEEWEVLYRQRLQVERDLLAGRAPGSVLPTEAGSPLGDRVAAEGERVAAGSGRGAIVGSVAAVAGFALIAVDVALALLDRNRRAR